MKPETLIPVSREKPEVLLIHFAGMSFPGNPLMASIIIAEKSYLSDAAESCHPNGLAHHDV
jgi:hypothetical protein